MTNTRSLNEINKTANMDPNLLTRHSKLRLMNDFMHIKYQNPKMRQSEIAKHLNMSSSTLQRYRTDINMPSPYRINPNNVKKLPKMAKIDDIGDLKRPQMTSNDLKTSSNETVKNRKNKLKAGSIIEINEHYLDKILKNNDAGTLLSLMLFIFELV